MKVGRSERSVTLSVPSTIPATVTDTAPENVRKIVYPEECPPKRVEHRFSGALAKTLKKPASAAEVIRGNTTSWDNKQHNLLRYIRYLL